jgi:hypothetical protein
MDIDGDIPGIMLSSMNPKRPPVKGAVPKSTIIIWSTTSEPKNKCVKI